MFKEKYCKIINRFTGKIIAAGKIINIKSIPVKCITFDNRYFFNLKKKILYKCIFCDYCDEIKFDNIKYKNKIVLWKNSSIYPNALVYREYDINELDEEIKELVYAINDIPIRTCGSCCGHGTMYAWVDICFTNFNQIRRIIDILNINDFKNKFTLETFYDIVNEDSDVITLRLKTNKIGKEAYKDINELVKYINLIKDV